VYARDGNSGQLNAFFIPPVEKMFHYARHLPAELSLLRCDNPAVVFSAFKQAERTKEAYICRVYNISGERQVAELEFYKPLSEVYIANLNEQRRRKLPFFHNKVVISLPPHKIRTLYLKFFVEQKKGLKD
ncbi:MAG: glycosyl hydrolase-related protein, partial [Candidatus Sumerlaeia bacterium]|nr:glycosyl hydrolase-related protein [Candidatus Sumerlaeia bacterium]